MSTNEEPLPAPSDEWNSTKSIYRPPRSENSAFVIAETEETNRTINEGMSEEDLADERGSVFEPVLIETHDAPDHFDSMAAELSDESDEMASYSLTPLSTESSTTAPAGSESMALPSSDELSKTSNSDEITGTEEDPEILYKMERPFKKILIRVGIALVAAFVLLFAVGFIMGLADIRPPTFDSQIISDKIDSLTNNTAPVEDGADELAKNTP